MNNFSLESLRVLDAIEVAGSFAGAAQMLHKVPSAVSHAVRKLEGELGITLFERVGRDSVFTPAGREVLAEARRILRSVAHLQTRARYVAHGWEPSFCIALDHLLPLRLLMPVLEDFVDTAPHVAVSVTRETLDGSWDALVWRRADLAIGAGGMGPPVSECVRASLGTMPLVQVVAPGHPLAGSHAGDASAHCYLDTADTARSPGPGVLAPGGGRRIALVDLRDKLEALRGGLGYGLLPRGLAQAEIAAGRLVEIGNAGDAPVLDVQYAYRRQALGKALDWFANQLATRGASLLEAAF